MTQLETLNGTPLSHLCFGAMQFGGTADAGASRAMYDACRAAGVSHFDTAHAYTAGASETLLGQFIKAERDAIYVATKLAYTGGAGRLNINATFDGSQKRLRLDCIDLLYLHRFDSDTPLEETFEALARLQQSGKIRHIGVAAYSPLGAGLLTGKDTSRGDARLATDSRYAARYGQAWMHQTARDLAALAAQMQAEPATLAVAWAAHHQGVSCPILSARTVN